MSNKAPALEWMEPPAAGLRTLQGRIGRRVRHRFIATGCAVVTLVAGVLIQNSLNVPVRGQPFDEIIARHAEKENSARLPFRVVDGAALELPSPSSNARVYLVSTLQGEPDPGSG